MSSAINRVIVIGRLTRDPDLRNVGPDNTPLCVMRIAVPRRYEGDGRPARFFTVKVWGTQGERCQEYLAKGRQIAVDGELDHYERRTGEGEEREYFERVEIAASTVQFLDRPRETETTQHEHDPEREELDVDVEPAPAF